MKRFIKKALVFLTVGIALAHLVSMVAFYFIHHLDMNDYGDLNKITQGEINADILFTGSSRTHVHFNTLVVDSVLGNQLMSYNLGQDGEQLTVQLGILKSYLKHNKPPKVIVQGLDIFTTSQKEDVVNKRKYFPYLDEPEIYQALSRIDSSVWLQKYIPLYAIARFNEYVTNQFLEALRNKKVKIKGFTPRYLSWDGKFEEFKKENPEGQTFPIEERAIAHLEEFIRLCKENNIHLILTYTPEFYESHDMVRNREEIIQTFQKVADEYNVPFWDYSEDPITLEKQYFYNAQHLNATGAHIFSEHFAKKLQKHLSSVTLTTQK